MNEDDIEETSKNGGATSRASDGKNRFDMTMTHRRSYPTPLLLIQEFPKTGPKQDDNRPVKSDLDVSFPFLLMRRKLIQ